MTRLKTELWECDAQQTLYNRRKRSSDKLIFVQMMAGLAADQGEENAVMIDAAHLNAHRTATSMGVKKGGGRLIQCPAGYFVAMSREGVAPKGA